MAQVQTVTGPIEAEELGTTLIHEHLRNADARRSADHGYIGVVGYTRGKACAPGPIEPYRHDGADAAALIDWIARDLQRRPTRNELDEDLSFATHTSCEGHGSAVR